MILSSIWDCFLAPNGVSMFMVCYFINLFATMPVDNILILVLLIGTVSIGVGFLSLLVDYFDPANTYMAAAL